ncbi:hypothetical protein ACJJTC_009282 [Scirpophaga incertulas]
MNIPSVSEKEDIVLSMIKSEEVEPSHQGYSHPPRQAAGGEKKGPTKRPPTSAGRRGEPINKNPRLLSDNSGTHPYLWVAVTPTPPQKGVEKRSPSTCALLFDVIAAYGGIDIRVLG